MTLLTLQDAELAYGDQPLLDKASLSVQEGQRIGLIGRNGTGKSSLMKVLAGLIYLEDGIRQVRDGLRMVYLPQEPELAPADTLFASLLARPSVAAVRDDRDSRRLQARIAEYLQRLGVDGGRAVATASGGEKKRAALALALALPSDLILLDEPTNHLDIAAIERLEEILKAEIRGARALMVVTHDRAFLDGVCTDILELDRGMLHSYPGNFAKYEEFKEDQLAVEAVERRKFDKFWAQEEVWIRKGIEARRTRNEGRVRRLEQLRLERENRRERLGSIRMSIDAGEKSGKIVAEFTDVTKRFGDRAVVDRFSMRLMRGDRLGLIGRNGIGKSTMIKLILGLLQPDEGQVRLGTNIQVAYFDQLREALDPDKTVRETIAPGSDWIEIGSERKHVMTYLADFLFPARRANVPVSSLSGGERNRLLLARLFARPANLLVLDEPTNDLDIDSLELLERTLQDYPGTLILVSHDRRFLDNVVTQVFAPEGKGRWREYPGGYSDWIAQRPADFDTDAEFLAVAKVRTEPAEKLKRAVPARPVRVRMSFKETRELEGLPAELEALEAEQQALNDKMMAADYHRQDPAVLKADALRAEELPGLIEQRYARWEELEQKAKEAAVK